ncbi:hypothetical protein ONZ45_g4234 [Pleurotus djamor]|nr:hypothetical protein ONZ45_g4234 [Pleurotus djamor]
MLIASPALAFMSPPPTMSNFDRLLKILLVVLSNGKSHHSPSLVDLFYDRALGVQSVLSSATETDTTRVDEIQNQALAIALKRLERGKVLDASSIKMLQDVFSSTGLKAKLCRSFSTMIQPFIAPAIYEKLPTQSSVPCTPEQSTIFATAWSSLVCILNTYYPRTTMKALVELFLPLVDAALSFFANDPRVPCLPRKVDPLSGVLTQKHIAKADHLLEPVVDTPPITWGSFLGVGILPLTPPSPAPTPSSLLPCISNPLPCLPTTLAVKQAPGKEDVVVGGISSSNVIIPPPTFRPPIALRTTQLISVTRKYRKSKAKKNRTRKLAFKPTTSSPFRIKIAAKLGVLRHLSSRSIRM